MDKQHSCRNKCIFCFIDQMPKGMPESLYSKDDDSAFLSFFGNYINADQSVRARDQPDHFDAHLPDQHLGSHHQIPVRVKMMGNRCGGDPLHPARFAKAGIRMNTACLCPASTTATGSPSASGRSA